MHGELRYVIVRDECRQVRSVVALTEGSSCWTTTYMNTMVLFMNELPPGRELQPLSNIRMHCCHQMSTGRCAAWSHSPRGGSWYVAS